MTPKKQQHIFDKSGFNNLSTDYKLLWELIFKDYRIPAWIVYSDEYSIIWDLVEVKKAYGTHDSYSIGCRGISYNGWETKSFKDFEIVCISYSLHFINPVL